MNSRTTTAENLFDRLPDELLLIIFSKAGDAKSLAVISSLSRRFYSLIPLTNSISLSFPSPPPPLLPPKTRLSFAKTPFAFLLDRLVRRPVRRFFSPKSRVNSRGYLDGDDIFSVVGDRLRFFKDVRDVSVELPCDGVLGGGTFLKWHAEFGSQLKSCVILGAEEIRRIGDNSSRKKELPESNDEPADSLLGSDELKLRVVWIISCLIAATCRHYMMSKIITSNPSLRKIEVGDQRRQGKVVMGGGEVNEVRKEGNGEDEAERSKVPDLRMKLWYAPELELGESGYWLRGATLVVVMPVKDRNRKDEECEILDGVFAAEEEEEVFGEAVREMRKGKKLYVMEMNSF